MTTKQNQLQHYLKTYDTHHTNMATDPLPTSRLDTLPAEVQGTIFNYAFSGWFMDIKEDGDACVGSRDPGNP